MSERVQRHAANETGEAQPADEAGVAATAEPRYAAGGSALEVLGVSKRLGPTSFGGPSAHPGYFRAEYVTPRKWLGETTYADLVAPRQFLPGPASSQVGIGVVLMRALGGAALAFAG